MYAHTKGKPAPTMDLCKILHTSHPKPDFGKKPVVNHWCFPDKDVDDLLKLMQRISIKKLAKALVEPYNMSTSTLEKALSRLKKDNEA